MKANLIILILAIALNSSSSYAQDTKVIEILDTNLFLTKDSVKIKMANLDVPSQNDPDSSRQILAQRIMKYNHINLLNESVRIEKTTLKQDEQSQVKSIHLFKKFPLEDLNINKEFIEKGYGVYIPGDTLFMEEYLRAAEYAVKNKEGIWKRPVPLREKDLFNRFRSTFWVNQIQFWDDRFIPLFGFNYRWSGLIKIWESNPSLISLSAEAGTAIYFFLPYATLGAEYRYKRIYVREHFDIFFHSVGDWSIERSSGFWGTDLGFILLTGNRTGLEVELNLKFVDKDILNLMSINFTFY